MSRDDQLDALLARGRLSGAARERALEGALARSGGPVRQARWKRWLIWGALPAAASAAVVLIAWPRGAFHPKGGGVGPVIEIACRTGARDRCPSGETLLFRVDDAAEPGFLAAWAEPASGGERVWYFPEAGGQTPAVAAQAGPQVLRRGVRLGSEQAPGGWRVHLLLSRRSLSREEALAEPPPELIVGATVALEVTP